MTAESSSQRPSTLTRPSGEFGPIPRLDGLTILVVDDEYDARRLMKRFLEVRGAAVTTAASVDEAMEQLGDLLPDVLLSDIGMPDHDGYELIQRVRDLPDEEGGATPAVAITAFARADDRERALMSGFQMHMAKPVDPLALLSAIARLAGRRY
jgi:CheY-like chemotaxis protein